MRYRPRLIAIAAMLIAMNGCAGISALTMDVATESMIEDAMLQPPPPQKPALEPTNDQLEEDPD